MGVGFLIGFFILVILVIIFVLLLIRTVKRKSKVGMIIYGIILVALLSIFFTNNIDGILITKQDVKNDLKHFNVQLKDDFEIENNSVSGMPERNQETKLKISEKDAKIILNEIRNAENFVNFKNDAELIDDSTSENVKENGEILNFKYSTFYSRELYKTVDNISTRLFLNIKENENILEYQKIE
ncbi:hypothetical protein JE952_002540 [Flavobacterium psychrophilum]|nr:hypothetical protein [Flavobacterium psychrophilum]